jgi:hypothetical protein
MPDQPEDDDVRWYTYTLWFWAAFGILSLLNYLGSGESSLFDAFEGMR